MIKSKLVKLANVSVITDQSRIKVKVGDVFEGYFNNWPLIGTSFYFYEKYVKKAAIDNSCSEDIDTYRSIQTSIVSSIFDERTFKTNNSVYKIVTVEDERDEKIKLILEE